MTTEGKNIKEIYQLQARSQYRGEPLDEPVELWVKFYFDNKTKRDNDNFKKIVKDALSGICWVDDSQVFIEHSEKHIGVGKENSRVEIIITPCKFLK